MANVDCSRCGKPGDPVPFKPFPNELGQRILDRICGNCWGEWLTVQKQLINHYGLDLRQQQAKDFLYAQLEQHLFTNAPRS
jgi:Fe-S cluster biosynthesis and repair protein YggX